MPPKYSPRPWILIPNVPMSDKGSQILYKHSSGVKAYIADVHSDEDARLFMTAPDMADAIHDFLKWGAMTSSDMEGFKRRFRRLLQKIEGVEEVER